MHCCNDKCFVFDKLIRLALSRAKYSSIADQVAAAASASIELQTHNQKANKFQYLHHHTLIA
jgi:hypothetical protein